MGSEQLELTYTPEHRDRIESAPVRRELDSRRAHGVDVVIWWIKKSNLCLVTLTELDRNRAVEFAVEADEVADALQHPYYYMYLSGQEFPPTEGDE